MNCEWIAWCALKPEAQAAWVQAIGSVVAIAVAVFVPRSSDNRRESREADKERRELAAHSAREAQEQAKEQAVARSHAVNLIRELRSISEAMQNRVADLARREGSLVDTLSKAYFSIGPRGGKADRDRNPEDTKKVSEMADALSKMLPSFEVSQEVRENVPRLALMPGLGDRLLSLIVSLDNLHHETRMAINLFKQDTFKSDPFPPLKRACERTKELADQASEELMRLFSDAARVE
ncbi:hypothetical protein [Xanthomonas sp. Leaf148]|uniref:hypothetical protein n=1 Tax=Xanthomonas sp. Leaf148 TaxID=1736275 RepID=UPI000A45C971|nr:hypothetical protein [Xanthomonas sp. Leaf148]